VKVLLDEAIERRVARQEEFSGDDKDRGQERSGWEEEE
jgi:hypothetical protein